MQPLALPNSPTCAHAHNDPHEVARPLANFYSSIWGDSFLNYTTLDEDTKRLKEEEAKELQQQVRKELLAVVKDPKERLIFIDAVERLGVAYHFEEEIEATLHSFCSNHYVDDRYKDDLHYVSLRFRLLRQHGFYVSSDVFIKFKDENGSFKNNPLTSEVLGILNLYEASYLRTQGEHILEEAMAFTTRQLTSFASKLGSLMDVKIKHALSRPLHRCTPRLEAKYQISFYESEPSQNKILLRFAKLDFDLLQLLHKEELQELTRWWKNLDFTTKLPFARDRLVEGYFWIVAANPEPKYSFGRIIFTKFLKMVSVLDDIYDAYGTIQELELFTEAIQRWDKSYMSQLPDYMKLVYETILDTTQLLEQDYLAKEGRTYAAYYLQLEIKDLCSAYLQEAKWCHANYVPTYEEYEKNGIVSTCHFSLFAAAYQGMKIADKDVFEWLRQKPKAAIASAIIGRLLDDMGSHKFEQNRKHVATAVEIYIKQFGVSQEEAYEKLHGLVEDGWKNLTEDMFRPTDVPRPLLLQILNLTRILHEVYKIDLDGYTMSKKVQHKVAAILIDNFDLI